MRLKQVALQGLGLLARRGLLALAFLLMARNLGPRLFGDYSYLYTWVYAATLLSALGLPSVSTREIALDHTKAGAVLKSSFLIRLLCVLVAMTGLALLFYTTKLTRSEIVPSALLFTLAIPPLAFGDQLAAYVMGFAKNSTFAFIQGSLWGAFLVATVASVATSHGLTHAILMQVVALWIAGGICAAYLKHDFVKSLQARINWTVTWSLLREAVPLAVTSVLGILSFRFGTFFLYKKIGAESTGLYTSSLQIVEGLQLIPMALTGSLFPHICQSAADSCATLDCFRLVSSTLAFISVFVAATVSVTSERLVPLVFGSQFKAGGQLLAILIWACVPMFLHYALTFFLIAFNRQRVFVWETLAYLFVSIVGNVLLIPTHGVFGAVFAATIPPCPILLTHFWFILQHLRAEGALINLALPLGVAALVVGASTPWKHAINANSLHLLIFVNLSALLFGSVFVFYQRFATFRRGAASA